MKFIKKVSKRLTQATIGVIFRAMTKEAEITPEGYKEIEKLGDDAKRRRDETIRRLRKEDPDYWTFERLAQTWNTRKQNIDYIINGDPRKKKKD